uniref:Insulin-like domain-containing protein n=2 Tax=Cuerna arida TaxID=1464854 RepID=A0A1B6GJG2_9HEMI
MSVSLKIAALLLTVCLMVVGCAARNAPLVKRSSSHYCGPNLVQALQLVCNSEYQPLYKKASHNEIYDQVEDYGVDHFKPEDTPLFPFMVPMEVHLARQGVRVRRGVSDECCYKRCSIAVLKSYCA